MEPTKLFATNTGVDSHNQKKLAQLPHKGKQTYHARDTGNEFLSNQIQRHCKAPETLELRVGAAVMLLKNLDTQNGLVNGSRGIVVRFEQQHNDTTVLDGVDGEDATYLRAITKPRRGAQERDVSFPICRFEIHRHRKTEKGQKSVVEYREIKITREEWSIEQEADKACRSQLPLTLAWALSIHKAQGMTIAPLEVDLRSCFEVGQAYVALSRATALDQLRVLGFRREQVRVSPDVCSFYESLTSASTKANNLGGGHQTPIAPPRALQARSWTKKKTKKAPRALIAAAASAADDDDFFSEASSIDQREKQQQEQQQRKPQRTAAQIEANRKAALKRLKERKRKPPPPPSSPPPQSSSDVLIPLKKKAARQWTDGPYRPHWAR